MSAGAFGSGAGAFPRAGGAGKAAPDAFIITSMPICPLTGSVTGILNVVDVDSALFHSPSSPTFSTFACSVNFALGAIGAFDASCATSAARYVSAMFSRQARSHDAAWAPADDPAARIEANANAAFIVRRLYHETWLALMNRGVSFSAPSDGPAAP